MSTTSPIIWLWAAIVSLEVLSSHTFAQAAKESRPQLQIINGSEQPIDVFWLADETGERRPAASVEVAGSQIISTTIGHRFVIVGRNDRAEAQVTARRAIQAIRFTGEVPLRPVVAPVGVVMAPPAGLGIPAFYEKFLSAEGLPIVASKEVDDHALKEAAYLVNMMLAKRPDIRAAMIDSGSRLCIIGHNEFTTDLPEFRNLQAPRTAAGFTAKDYWDARARGTGGSRTDPFFSCGEENLLGYPDDPYSTENILIHEISHNIHLRGLANIDPTFDERLKVTYAKAMEKGLWSGKYASVNHHEYFAEGVQSWFDDNRENDHDHNHVNTRQELVEYDSGLAEICREVFGDTEFKYVKPQFRLHGHLADYQPQKAPKFVWPDRLLKIKAELIRQASQRAPSKK
ncbi:MAG: hypothetical protein C0478_11625 [Planctomyces sp.]|nr:hypothetical protein [Planctomyces sp.]